METLGNLKLTKNLDKKFLLFTVEEKKTHGCPMVNFFLTTSVGQNAPTISVFWSFGLKKLRLSFSWSQVFCPVFAQQLLTFLFFVFRSIVGHLFPYVFQFVAPLAFVFFHSIGITPIILVGLLHYEYYFL
jgi:hypothetical protein